MRRWRFMLWGGIGSGKTTLIRALEGSERPVRKTQMVEFDGMAIDTPGEYSESRRLARHLLSTAFDAQLLVVTQDATRADSNFPPHYFLMFRQPVIGVVTKIDAPGANVARARAILRRVGVTGEIFCVSSVTGEGLSELRQALEKRRLTWQEAVATQEKRSA